MTESGVVLIEHVLVLFIYAFVGRLQSLWTFLKSVTMNSSLKSVPKIGFILFCYDVVNIVILPAFSIAGPAF